MKLFLSLIFALALLALLSAIPAFAAGDPEQPDIILQWDHATQREDGTALPLDEIAGYKIYHTPPGATERIYNLAPVTSHQLLDVFFGSHTFEISTVDTDGRESAKSAPVTVPAGNPPPVSATVRRIIVETCDSSGACAQETVYDRDAQ